METDMEITVRSYNIFPRLQGTFIHCFLCDGGFNAIFNTLSVIKRSLNLNLKGWKQKSVKYHWMKEQIKCFPSTPLFLHSWITQPVLSHIYIKFFSQVWHLLHKKDCYWGKNVYFQKLRFKYLTSEFCWYKGFFTLSFQTYVKTRKGWCNS